MQNPDVDALDTADLAACDADLSEWDRLWVRDYWGAVIAEELGAPQSPASPYAWPSVADVGDPEWPVLRLLPGGASGGSAVGSEEEAA